MKSFYERHQPSIMYMFGVLLFFLYLLNPVKAHAAWAYFPSEVTRIYAQGVNATTGQGYTIATTSVGTMYFDTTSHTFKDINALSPSLRPPLNPDMTGLPVVTYGAAPYTMNEVQVVAGLKQVLPFVMLALFSGFVAAFAPAYLIKFLRGITKSY